MYKKLNLNAFENAFELNLHIVLIFFARVEAEVLCKVEAVLFSAEYKKSLGKSVLQRSSKFLLKAFLLKSNDIFYSAAQQMTG